MIDRPLRVLMYHRILDGEAAAACNPSIISATPAAFDEQMRHVAGHYRVVRVEEVLHCLRDRRSLPRRALLITFDDGCRDFGEVAWPILRRYHLPATVFVPTAYPGCPGRPFWWDRLYCALRSTRRRGAVRLPFGMCDLNTPESRRIALGAVERFVKATPHGEAMALVEILCRQLGEEAPPPSDVLGWDDLRGLTADGVSVGAHTRTHPALTRVAPEEARAEIAASREDLQREIGMYPPVFAYPFGDHDERIATLVRDEGFEMGMTCRDGHSRLPGSDQFRVRRTGITPRTTAPILRARLTVLGTYVDTWRHRTQGRGTPAAADGVTSQARPGEVTDEHARLLIKQH